MVKNLFTQGRLAEIFRFAITGGLSFIVDYGTMVAMVELFAFDYLWATGISFTLSVIVNYLLCVVWVFDGVDRSNKKSMAIFLLTSIIGLGLNQLFMWILVDCASIHYMLSKIITTLLVMIWNYITKRKALVK
ncbi:GtrA-like protein [uncultured Clostridium sp.]|nr:GtrA-like protein [uncultured Clostridium sp.]